MSRRSKKYDDIIERYMTQYPMLSNSAIAREIIDKEDTVSVSAGYLRDVIGEYLRELKPENVRLSKSRQKQMDRNRIERKAFREYARVENAVEEYGKAISKELKKHGKALSTITLPPIPDKELNAVGVFQISDLHGNELIDLPHNKYDFTVMAKRAKAYVHRARTFFKAWGITKVLVAMTGDLLNSDRRLDELLSMATNRAKASILTTHILKMMLLDLRQDFELDVISVMGNESRMHKDMSSHTHVLSDNYDFTIVANLKMILEAANITGINFLSHDQMEQVVDLMGQKWLITHDYQKASAKQDKAQSTIGRHLLSGHHIDYIITGHIHATRITDIIARSSSMAGSNEYNENFLNLAGRAAQNIYIVTPQSRYAIAVDLQNVDGIEGYDIVHELEAYNAKSADKTRDKVTIFEVKI